MDLEEIKNIIALMKEHELSYFNLETEDTKIKLKRGTDFEALEQALASVASAPAPLPQPAAPQAPTGAGKPEAVADGLLAITSPMVGTFYRSASPDTESFVEIGTRVDKETVVCIIEAMKVMNEIQAEVSGTIVEILASNTDPVQYGEPLFRIKPD